MEEPRQWNRHCRQDLAIDLISLASFWQSLHVVAESVGVATVACCVAQHSLQKYGAEQSRAAC